MLPNLDNDQNKFILTLESDFKAATGLELRIYMSLLWACSASMLNGNLSYKPGQVPNSVVPKQWFATTKISPTILESFFREVSFSLGIDQASSGLVPKGAADFTVIQDKPFFRDEDNLYCLDARFATEKFDAGLFWTVANLKAGHSKDKFFSMWGKLFEKYVEWIPGESCDGGKNTHIALPRFLDSGEELCDGIILSGNEVVSLPRM